MPSNYEYGYNEVFTNREAAKCLVKEDETEESSQLELDVVSKLDQTFRECIMSPLFILNVIYFGVLCLR